MSRYWWLAGLALALLVALLSPLASPHPDGLERVAEDQGFIAQAQEPQYELAPDYVFPGIENEALATIAAGVAGTLGLFVLMLGVGRLLRARQRAT